MWGRALPTPFSGSSLSIGSSDRYRRLLSLEVRHQFYKDGESDDQPCPDLEIAPSPSTARLIASLGLLFRPTRCGCDVLIGEQEAATLPARIAALRARAAEAAPGGPEGRRAAAPWLTFLLNSTRADFVSITNLPIDFKPTERNVYLSNLDAEGEPGAATLAAATSVEPESLIATTGRQVLWPEADIGGEANVVVTDISGAVVLSGWRGATPVIADLGALPCGLYTVAVGAVSRRLIYAPVHPPTFGVVDIALAPSSPGAAGVYPAPALDASPERIGGVHYIAPFKARRTYWDYYVAPLAGNEKLVDLAIDGKETAFEAQADGRLPDGRPATAFRSQQPLLLCRRSPYIFQLSGSRIRRDGSQGEIRIGRLPSAPAAPVWPVEAGAASSQTGRSEIFVYV